MHKFNTFIEEKLAPHLIKFAQLKYVKIIQKTFLSLTALLIVGSLFLLAAQLPIPAYQKLIGEFASVINLGSGVATGIMSILVAVSASIATVDYYKQERGEEIDVFGTTVLSLASFLLVNPAVVVNTITNGVEGTFKGYSTAAFGSIGVFSALIISITSVEIFRFLINKNIKINMPAGVPPMVTQAFAALIPATVVTIFWWFIRFVVGLDITQLISMAIQPFISAGDTSIAVLIITFVTRLLWSVGIHGASVVNGVAQPIWQTMNVANLEAAQAGLPLPHVFSGYFIDNYVWLGLAPVAIVLIFSRSKRLKSLGLLALPAAIFNIGEPLLFGIPIVLNPILFIPHMVSFMVYAFSSIVGSALSILPVPILNIPWVTPAPIKAFLSTNGSIEALLFVLLMWVVTIFIYLPFIKIIEKNDLVEAEAALAEQNGDL